MKQSQSVDDAPVQPTPVSPPEPASTASSAAPAPTKSPPPALEYDRSGNHVTRGQFRILLILMFVNTVAIVGYLAVPGGAQWARQTWKEIESKRAAKRAEQAKRDARQKHVDAFQKALPALASMKLPADKPTYTEDGIEAASLLASDPAYQTVNFERMGHDAKEWQAAVGRGTPPEAEPLRTLIASADGSGGRAGTAFLHAVKNSAGAQRLVWCELLASQRVDSAYSDRYGVRTSRALSVRLIDPGSATEPPHVVATVNTEFDQGGKDQAEVQRRDGQVSAKTPQIFRLLNGVPDPADPTRFQIPYVMNGAAGAFHVRVRDDDRLLVEPSEGRVAERSGDRLVSQKWDPSGEPPLRLSESGAPAR